MGCCVDDGHRVASGKKKERGKELLEAGTGFSEFAFLVGLLAKTQNFRVYIAFWTRIVPCRCMVRSHAVTCSGPDATPLASSQSR